MIVIVIQGDELFEERFFLVFDDLPRLATSSALRNPTFLQHNHHFRVSEHSIAAHHYD